MVARLAFKYELVEVGIRFSLLRTGRLRTNAPLPCGDWNRRAGDALRGAVSTLLDYEDNDNVKSDETSITLPHAAVAGLDRRLAQRLGLPTAPPFILNIQGQGTVDQETFRLTATWLEQGGQAALGVERKGCMLSRGDQDYRLSKPIFTLLEEIEKFNQEDRPDGAAPLKAWACLRAFLEIDDSPADNPILVRDNYLANSRIVHAGAFSLSLTSNEQGFDFEPLLFAPLTGRLVDDNGQKNDSQNAAALVSEAAQLLPPSRQRYFAEQRFLGDAETRDRYALQDGWYVVLDEPLRQALDVVREVKQGDRETRRRFVKNPRAFLNNRLRNEWGEGLDEGLIEALFVETAEYSQRVIDAGLWEAPAVPWVRCEGDAWLPERFGLRIGDRRIFLDNADIAPLREAVAQAMGSGNPSVNWDSEGQSEAIPATQETLDALDAMDNIIHPQPGPLFLKEQDIPELQAAVRKAMGQENTLVSCRGAAIAVTRESCYALAAMAGEIQPVRVLKTQDRPIIFVEEQHIPALQGEIEAAMEQGEAAVNWDGEPVAASDRTLRALAALTGPAAPPRPPVVLIIKDNLDEQDYTIATAPTGPVRPALPEMQPHCLKTALKPHQEEGLAWLQKAWKKGQGGLLLADDMGLGKTLQTLSFLAWLRQAMADGKIAGRPLLIVAPTGLLKNWREEHEHHLHKPGLGSPLLAHGKVLHGLRTAEGTEIELGETVINVAPIQSAQWVLTTYEALRDYQHSFGTIRFAVIVFDEMQKIKTPGALMTHAAKAMNGDFIIGLTGTPIENRLADLWCIIDTVMPGYLGDLKTFSQRYENDPDEDALSELKRWLEESPQGETEAVPQSDQEPIMLRRMKADELPGLPQKIEHLRPGDMPEGQRLAYSAAVRAVREHPGRGGMLETLHDLKSLSLHPNDPQRADFNDDYIQQSARFISLFKILDDISQVGEKALVFVEARAMQEPLAGFIQRRYQLARQPMIISGAVSGAKRQQRVNEFQTGEAENTGFDVMILSPRAGGVGLTLTAANHVIHLSRWWNPAVEDQCTDRVFRIGQERTVQVYYLQARHPDFPDGAFDERLHALLERKRKLCRDMLRPPVDRANDTRTLYEGAVGKQQPARRSLDDIDHMEPTQFEDWCLAQLKQAGYQEVRRTPQAWDAGADGIAKHSERDEYVIIQCKHTQTNQPCDATAISDLLRASHAYGEPDALLAAITNAPCFTDEAISKLAAHERVRLVARDVLLDWPDCLRWHEAE